MTAPPDIAFARLTGAPLATLVAHMNHPRMAAHLPLLTEPRDEGVAARFLAAKEARCRRDGPGHWAIPADGADAGWGGFERDGADWDFGLVLRAESFGLRPAVARRALAFARADPRIASVTFLPAPLRRGLGALPRLGAHPLGEVEHAGARFVEYLLGVV